MLGKLFIHVPTSWWPHTSPFPNEHMATDAKRTLPDESGSEDSDQPRVRRVRVKSTSDADADTDADDTSSSSSSGSGSGSGSGSSSSDDTSPDKPADDGVMFSPTSPPYESSKLPCTNIIKFVVIENATPSVTFPSCLGVVNLVVNMDEPGRASVPKPLVTKWVTAALKMKDPPVALTDELLKDGEELIHGIVDAAAFVLWHPELDGHLSFVGVKHAPPTTQQVKFDSRIPPINPEDEVDPFHGSRRDLAEICAKQVDAILAKGAFPYGCELLMAAGGLSSNLVGTSQNMHAQTWQYNVKSNVVIPFIIVSNE